MYKLVFGWFGPSSLLAILHLESTTPDLETQRLLI